MADQTSIPTGTTGVESPTNPTGGLVETPAQAAVQPGQFENPIETTTPATPTTTTPPVTPPPANTTDQYLSKTGVDANGQQYKDKSRKWDDRMIDIVERLGVSERTARRKLFIFIMYATMLLHIRKQAEMLSVTQHRSRLLLVRN